MLFMTEGAQMRAHAEPASTRGSPARRPLAGPLYSQVADLLRQRLYDLEWAPGRPIPTEHQLSKEIGVSIGTIRKALEALEEENLIVRRQGRGTFVREADAESEMQQFSCIVLNGEKVHPRMTLVSCGYERATMAEIQALDLKPPHTVVRLHRNCRDATLSIDETITIDKAAFDGIHEVPDLTAPLLFATYRLDYHVIVASVKETVAAAICDARVAKALDIEPGTPLLAIDRIAQDRAGRPVEWSRRHVHCSGSRYEVAF